MKYFILIIAIFFNSCGVKTHKASNYHFINIQNYKRIYKTLPYTIKVLTPKGISYINSSDMKYIKNAQIFSYAYNEWGENPSKQIKLDFVKSLINSNLFSNVISDDSRARYDFILESTVFSFEQIFKEEQSFVRFLINVRILDKNSNIIQSKNFNFLKPTNTNDASGFKFAIQEVLTSFYEQNIKWISLFFQKK